MTLVSKRKNILIVDMDRKIKYVTLVHLSFLILYITFVQGVLLAYILKGRIRSLRKDSGYYYLYLICVFAVFSR